MVKYILLAVLCLMAGAFAGNAFTNMTARRHQHTRSVMGLAQYHLDRLDAAARAGQCPAFEQERGRLLFVYDELLQAFPKAYAQDTEFHKRADALRDAVRAGEAAPEHCVVSSATAAVKHIGDACDDCHHEYR
ncbi:MAG TPA: cytochrome c [Steroidobacteraceae bacterium]